MKCSTWVQSHKWQNDLDSFQRQNHSTSNNPSLCPNHRCQKSWSWSVLWRLTPKKRCPFYHRGLECKSRKSRDTWSNRQVWPWSTNEAGQKLTEFCQENALVIANTLFQQHKRWLFTWHHQMVNTRIRLITFFAAEDGEALYSRQKQDLELTVA